ATPPTCSRATYRKRAWWPSHGPTRRRVTSSQISMVSATFGILATSLMMVAFTSTARLYEVGWLWRLTLPLAAALFVLMTVSSAWRYRRGRGGQWKGRVHQPVRQKDTVP
ncbi:MAG: hypothetical protein R3349_10625, partial [Geminicoccaceae bacterium]|nr:hypothetical protein [Geminicoccaceae bacterium]